jgi:tetraacyldisaccharide 4'-kinase
MMTLAPMAWLYGRVMQVRNAMYDRGILKAHDLGAKTISVGNITTGGTGKTPLVKLIAEILAENGEKVCILSRGYGRKNENARVVVCSRDTMVADPGIAGDEPVELARYLLGKAIIIADADRVAAANWAKENFGITVFVLDDAFQHRRVKRDLDLFCIDATNPFGGFLREPVKALARAHVIVMTRTEQIPLPQELVKKLSELAPGRPIFKAMSRLTSSEEPPEGNVFPFCGIGNPQNFFTTLARVGFDIPAERVFADHHVYSQNDITEMEAEAKLNQCKVLVTTVKDAVKLDGLKFELPLLVAEMEIVIDDPDRFRDFVLSV